MKSHFKDIINVIVLLGVFVSYAQDKSFYIRSIRSIHLENNRDVLQELKFKEVDVLYNKTCQFLNDKITVNTNGTYEISGFANINPGVMGNNGKDSINMELYVFKNIGLPTEQVIGKTAFTFTYGNFDVASGLLIAPVKINLTKGDAISLWVKILSTSTIDINKSAKYDHVTKPTGMEQIAGMRIAKLSQ